MWWEWVVWFLGVWGLFAILEGFALRHPDRMWTLSKAISTLGARWPLSIALLGMLFGGLLVHFYWPYKNPIGPSIGYAPTAIIVRI